ncbi:hypothetical protein GUJ93_ZPchr0014g46856 [Zizania palustris]|uniref:Copper transport protein n=1 Tax=Zizania palustris TaxID=103762 RepID=A0A8J5W6Q8_ZIZPA|nr:hypothetical protein GUJ93_ZPchr0014g46856 [Zizania palustris]
MRGMSDDGMGPMVMAPPHSGHSAQPQPPPPGHKMAMMTHMAFFWGDRAVVLFRGWPGERGAGMYLLCLLFVLALAALAEALTVLSRLLARRSARSSSSPGGPAQASSAALLTAVHAARMGLAYLVMLAVMSFNVGVLLAAVAGHALGFLLARSRVRPGAARDGDAARDGGGLPPSDGSKA